MNLEEKVDFMLGLLREREIHQDKCAVVGVAKSNAMGGAYYLPQPCDCWLSVPEDKQEAGE